MLDKSWEITFLQFNLLGLGWIGVKAVNQIRIFFFWCNLSPKLLLRDYVTSSYFACIWQENSFWRASHILMVVEKVSSL